MKIEELRARVSIDIVNAPRGFMFDPLPTDEIKVSHVQLIVGAVMKHLGYSVGDDGQLVPPKADGAANAG